MDHREIQLFDIETDLKKNNNPEIPQNNNETCKKVFTEKRAKSKKGCNLNDLVKVIKVRRDPRAIHNVLTSSGTRVRRRLSYSRT